MLKEKILGVLYGMALGDAMGMPPELWSRERLQQVYGKIEDFLDGHPDNVISYQYKKGNFTDDTSQALTILDSLIETDFIPNQKSIAAHILKWAKECNAEENNILGPTSKQTLSLIEKGEDASFVSAQAVSNGAAMRIPPIGTLFEPEQKKELCRYVAEISKATHGSSVTIAGACMVAMMVSCAVAGKTKDEMIQYVTEIEAFAASLGASVVAPSLATRIEYGVDLAKKYVDQEDVFLEKLYRMMGGGVNTADSVPCAVAIAYYSWGEPRRCALLCANLGGDTDTIGAMAVAACGGYAGISAISEEDRDLLEKANHINFETYAQHLCARREQNCQKDV